MIKIPVIPKTVRHSSWSSLKKYRQCSRRDVLHSVKKEREPESGSADFLIIGSVCHKVLELLLRILDYRLSTRGELKAVTPKHTEKDILEFLKQVEKGGRVKIGKVGYSASLDPNQQSLINPSLMKKSKEYLLGSLEGGVYPVVRSFLNGASPGSLRVEQSLAFDRFWNPVSPTDWARAAFRMVADAVWLNREKDFAYVLDWKTGKPSRDDDEQAKNNAALLWKVRPPIFEDGNGVAVVPLVSYVGRESRLDEYMEGVTPQEAERVLKGLVEEIKERGKDKKGAPTLGPLCRWCGYSTRADLCPEGADYVLGRS